MKITLEFEGPDEHDQYVQYLAERQVALTNYRAGTPELVKENQALADQVKALTEQIEGARKAVLEKTTVSLPSITRLEVVGDVALGTAPGAVIPQAGDIPPVQEPAVDLRAMFGHNHAVVQAAAVPTSAAAPAVPVLPQTTVPSPVAAAAHINLISPELDSDGLPWDPRIHSNPKKKNADNTWRAKRNVDKALVARVTSEYRQVMAIPANGDTRTVPLPLTAAQALPTLAAIPNVPALPVQPIVPPAPPVASSVPVPPPPPTARPTNVQELVLAITGKIAAGAFTQERVNEVCKEIQLPAIPLLAMRPDLIPVVIERLGL